MSIKDLNKEKINEATLSIILSSLLVLEPNIHTKLSIVGFVVLLLVNKKEGVKNIFLNIKRYYLVVILYLLYILGGLYSDNIPSYLTQLEHKASFVILPLLFSIIIYKININRLLYNFSIINALVFFIIILVKVIYHHNSLSINLFLYDKLIDSLPIHQSYIALYTAFSSIFIFNKKTVSNLFLFIFLSIIVLLLQVKSGIIILTIGVFVSILLNMKNVKSYLISFLVIVLIISQLSIVKDRFNEITNIDYTKLVGVIGENGVTQRIFFWKESVEIIKKNPIVGYGTGDVDDTLSNHYETLISSENSTSFNNSMKNLINFHLNPHSQYLQTWIAIGLLGFILLITIFINGIYIGYVNGSFMFLILNISFLIFSLVESGFERYNGIFFFMFLYTILLNDIKLSKNISK